MVKIAEGLIVPQASPQLLTADNFAGTFEKHKKDLQRLFREPQLMTVAAKFSRAYVSLKDPEAEDGSRNGAGNGHLFF